MPTDDIKQARRFENIGTVGDVINILKELPTDMKVCDGMGSLLNITIFREAPEEELQVEIY